MNLITGVKVISTIFRTLLNIPITVRNLFRKIRRRKAIKPKHPIFRHEFKMNFGLFEFVKRKLLES
jgi:hypothetical protein